MNPDGASTKNIIQDIKVRPQILPIYIHNISNYKIFHYPTKPSMTFHSHTHIKNSLKLNIT